MYGRRLQPAAFFLAATRLLRRQPALHQHQPQPPAAPATCSPIYPMPPTIQPTLIVTALVATSLLSATVYLEDNFTYADGPLAGQGPWVRGVASPSADNPSNHIVVADGAVRFDWTTNTPINNALRVQWAADQLTTGTVYAAFDIQVTEAPQAADDVRPGFFSFDRSGGSQLRGLVGLRSGTETGTYQLGVSASSQLGTSFVYAERDLSPGISYRVVVRYNLTTARTDLWIDAEPMANAPAATANGSPGDGVRRIQLRLYNASANGLTHLGIFQLDNLMVYTLAADDPDPDPNPDPEPGLAEVLLADTFAYDNGLLLATAPDWLAHAGAPTPRVIDNRLQLQAPASGDDGYITRNLSRSVASGWVYSGFTLDLPATSPLHPPVNLVFLTDATGDLGAGFVALERTTSGWRIGLRGSATGAVDWSADILAPASSGRWVMGFDTATGTSRLWRASDGPGATPRATAASSAHEISRVAIGAHPAMPEPPLTLRDLHVAASQVQAAAQPIDIVTLPQLDKVYLFLLIGQSNMAGRGAVEAADQVGNRRIAYYNANRQWQVARDPLHWDRPNFNGVGPALTFARELLAKLPPDAVIGLIPAAQGGTSITWWGKSYSGTNRYYTNEYLYPHALGRALEAAQIGTLTGILWNQGSTDASSAETDGGASYRTRLHRLIADLREDLNRPDLPFVVSTLGPWRTNSNAINQVFLSLPDEVPHTAVVNTLDPTVAPFLINNPADTPHYLTPSYRLLGQLYADITWQLLERQLLNREPPILGTTPEAGALRLRWRQPAWKRYHIEGSSALTTGWQTLMTFDTTEAIADFDFQGLASDSGMPRFYRLRSDSTQNPANQ
jgi:hypothetical protein